MELLADRTLISSKKKSNRGNKEKDKDLSDLAPDLPPPPLPISLAAGILGYKKLSSLSLNLKT